MKYNQYASWHSIVSLAVQQKGKHSVYIANNLEYETEKDLAVWDMVCKRFEDDQDLISDLICGGLFFFATEEEAREFFEFFNSTPIYSSGIYAELFDETGMGVTENT